MAAELKRNSALVIIPAFNEEKSIGRVVNDIIKNYSDVDVLVVNDGSFDQTSKVLIGKDIFVANHIFNMGTGASFQTGCLFASASGYDYIVRMDADGQHNYNFIKDVLGPVKSDEADIVIGSRFLGNSQFKSSLFRQLGISIINFTLSIITNQKITDPTSGFCAMNRRAFEFFSGNCPEDYPEPEILLYHGDFRIKEVPVAMARRGGGISSITPLKSVYYMAKVLLSLLMHKFRKEPK